MSAANEFVDNLKEVFSPFGRVEARAMFGGHGLYHDGLMFALVADEVLYLKADGQSVQHFTDLGLSQFEYVKEGRRTRISYWEAPESIFDDPQQAKEWAGLAYDAALRASRAKKPASKKG
jgi:DNA transformation protein